MSLLPCEEAVLEKKYWKAFEREAKYLGGNLYTWGGIYSTDTRELWLLGVLKKEGVVVEEEN